MKVKFLKGLPGSGKSTWAKKFCEKNPDWIRVSRDDLRNMRGKYWIPKQEKLITTMERSCIKSALIHGKNVIVDSTNLNPELLDALKGEIKLYGLDVEFETKVFDTSLEECIKRDLQRPNSVGQKVIKDKYNKYLKPPTESFEYQDEKLTKAIICDLDGTLCIHNGRSPFEYDKCDTDLVNKIVQGILDTHQYNHHIIFMSGREDSCIAKTRNWLINKAGFQDFDLYMRKTDDYRKDCIIKRELFDQHVKGKYFVNFVLDDRNQVVEMWRDMGLTCLQVNEGDF